MTKHYILITYILLTYVFYIYYIKKSSKTYPFKAFIILLALIIAPFIFPFHAYLSLCDLIEKHIGNKNETDEECF